MPRLEKKQTHRENYSVASVEDYFRVALFVPYLDSLIHSLSERFSDQNNPGMFLYNLHPQKLLKLCETELIKSIDSINKLYTIDNLKEESSTWLYFWRNQTQVDNL